MEGLDNHLNMTTAQKLMAAQMGMHSFSEISCKKTSHKMKTGAQLLSGIASLGNTQAVTGGSLFVLEGTESPKWAAVTPLDKTASDKDSGLVSRKRFRAKPNFYSSNPSSSLMMKNAKSKPATSGNQTLFFWCNSEKPYGPFCQWYSSPFYASILLMMRDSTGKPVCVKPAKGTPVVRFQNSEQFMMVHKALLFNDQESYHKIMASTDPREQKQLGKQVKNYVEKEWNDFRYEVVKLGNHYKFTQNTKLRDLLLSTGNREIVEASQEDPIWGVGYFANDAEENRSKWGQNLLGKLLMELREQFRNEDKIKEIKKNEEVKEIQNE